jgi:hypothetical protein
MKNVLPLSRQRLATCVLCLLVGLTCCPGCGDGESDDDDSDRSSRSVRGASYFSADFRPATPKELAQVVVETLRKNDEKQFLVLCYSRDDMQELFERNFDQAKIFGERREKVRPQMEKRWDDVLILYRRKFQEVQRESGWRNAQVDRIETGPVRKDKYGYEKAGPIYVYFKEGGIRGRLKIDEPSKVKSGWAVGGLLSFSRSSSSKPGGFGKSSD